MDDPAFRHWLAARSWALSVRYCKVVSLLLPPAALATDLPLLALGTEHLEWLVGWQVAAELVCLAVFAIDRWSHRWRGSEPALYAFCVAFIVLCTWIGMVDGLLRGDFSIYAAGLTFGAAVAATPRRVRQPLYAASLLALAGPVWLRTGSDPAALVTTLVNPFCVVMLCLWLDRITFSRDLALYLETRRAEAERERADHLLHNVLPQAVADELKRDRRYQARKHENLGVLFADIAGFTQYAGRLPPDALVVVLDQIFSSFDEVVERHGLEKIKTIGDAYMAVSDGRLPVLCQLALDLREALERYNRANGTALGMRIGIHAGPAVAGVLGTRRFLYDVWGDTVNIASRVESSGRAGCIHVTEAVVQQARDQFSFGARGLVELQGRGRILTWWLLGPQQQQATAMADTALA
ncbi:MAG TPA: adenylate/guanylate cyclase domain-containing protein [Ramlibacter sp.]|jgi:class 3 adenylate cyclase|uniref:adenylate/guanylate cyclase domain-containing protein n=1 Tax=Ramlibacter sp. TaxID=1917967 RepID=UPI002D562710|nr:adenylate/guanylate cyclase domain-containing protein [Ramlibacter sp.]HZY17164.1 adenylate/guanylate cyclase domain-containing protein [Ramlibacter sp.]